MLSSADKFDAEYTSSFQVMAGEQLVLCALVLCVLMLKNEGFDSNLLINEMYRQSTFDFAKLYQRISERVAHADKLLDAVEKELKKPPPHKMRQLMTNVFYPMLKKINSLQPVSDRDDEIEKIEF